MLRGWFSIGKFPGDTVVGVRANVRRLQRLGGGVGIGRLPLIENRSKFASAASLIADGIGPGKGSAGIFMADMAYEFAYRAVSSGTCRQIADPLRRSQGVLFNPLGGGALNGALTCFWL